MNGSLVLDKSSPRPATLDRSTQTEPTSPVQDTGKASFPLSRQIQSLQLEDALPPRESPVEGTNAMLHGIPGLEDEDEEQEDHVDGGVEQEKDMSWISSVEEPIQPTTVRGLQREDFQDGSCSPEEPSSGLSSVRSSDHNISSRSGHLSPIQEGEKKMLCVLPLLFIIIFFAENDCMALVEKSNLLDFTLCDCEPQLCCFTKRSVTRVKITICIQLE